MTSATAAHQAIRQNLERALGGNAFLIKLAERHMGDTTVFGDLCTAIARCRPTDAEPDPE